MAPDPYRYFRIEAREIVEQIGAAVLEMEKGQPDPALIGQVLRLAHTLKGAARVVKQPDIAEQAHRIESVLAPYRETGRPLDADHAAQVLRLLDVAGAGVTALDEPTPPTEQAPQPSPTRPAESVSVIRADSADLDELLDTIGEAHARFAPMRRGVATLERVRRGMELLTDQLAAPALRAGTDAAWHRARSIAAEIGDELAALGRGLDHTIEQAEREIKQVRGCADRLRLAPASTIFGALHRAVRDAAEAAGKRVDFEGHGGDVRLDPQVLTAVYGALLHAVRNAVAHGVEAPPDRLAVGKPAAGRIAVAVARRGRRVAFACRDDGRGFDLEAIRRAALANGLAGAGALDARELVGLVLRGGISTAGAVTGLAGRGIGLDAVRDVAQRLGGDVTVDTAPGSGATIEIVVPLSLLSLDGLVAEVAGVSVAIPLDAARSSLRLRPDEIAHTASGATVVHDGQAIPFLPLANVLPRQPSGVDTPPAPAAVVAVVVASGAGAVAVGVDRLLGMADMVVRPVPELAPAGEIVGGLWLDGEGVPGIVLDPDGLLAEAGRHGADHPVAPGAPGPRGRVLVIDDSLTTRMLERTILESAGYEVDVAVSGEDALEKAEASRYGLFLVDIEMPGMDGFTFVERTRADPALRDIPAILVSSRDSAEDRQRGVAAGACLHVAKSEFNQNELLAHIGKLVR